MLIHSMIIVYLNCGAITVGKDFKYGALDLNLDEIIPVEYDNLLPASPTRFIASRDNEYGLIDLITKLLQILSIEKFLTLQALIAELLT